MFDNVHVSSEIFDKGAKETRSRISEGFGSSFVGRDLVFTLNMESRRLPRTEVEDMFIRLKDDVVCNNRWRRQMDIQSYLLGAMIAAKSKGVRDEAVFLIVEPVIVLESNVVGWL